MTDNIPSSAVIPCLIGGGLNAYNLWNEHWEHWNHMPPLEERTEYPYQNIRSKNFPWGDGDKVSPYSRMQPTKLPETQLLTRSTCRPSCKFQPISVTHVSARHCAPSDVKLLHMSAPPPTLLSSHTIRIVAAIRSKVIANTRTVGTLRSTTK